MLHIVRFWISHPALFYGTSFALGITLSLDRSFWNTIPILCLWLPFIYLPLSKDLKFIEVTKPLALSLIVCLSGWFFVNAHFTFPKLPAQGLEGIAYIKIKNISLQPGIFGERWIYRCDIETLYPDNTEIAPLTNTLPCIIIFPHSMWKADKRPIANQDYQVKGKLIRKGRSYLLKVSARETWEAVPNTSSWAEQRYHWKRTISKWIESHFTNTTSATFIAGLATGEFDDQWMRQQFGRFGLLHLLAISGFHFAIIASFINFVLSLCLPQKSRIITLLLCLGIYCIFLGPQASILRAWMMCSLALLGMLIGKQTIALNSLGFALLAILVYNPLSSLELGFQLSFVTTAAILLFYSPSQAWLHYLIPKRNLGTIMEMNRWNQHGYCILSYFREAIALTIAVNIYVLPFSLYYFQQFPWMSLVYNLFFPFLTSLSICLALLGACASFIPFLAQFIHYVNDQYTFFILQLTYQLPSSVDVYLISERFEPFWLVIYFCAIALGGIIWNEKSASEDVKHLTFI